MGKEIRWRIQAGLLPLRNRYTKLFRIPAGDDGGELWRKKAHSVFILARVLTTYSTAIAG